MNLKNKKILITGATGGIGNCLVEKFDNLGSNIIATGTNEEKLTNLKKKFPKIHTEKFKLDEHKKIEDHIKKIEETEFSSPGWLVHLKNLKSLVEHHLDEEENEIFPVAGQVLERAEKNMLARKYKFEMEDSFAEQVRH